MEGCESSDSTRTIRQGQIKIEFVSLMQNFPINKSYNLSVLKIICNMNLHFD